MKTKNSYAAKLGQVSKVFKMIALEVLRDREVIFTTSEDDYKRARANGSGALALSARDVKTIAFHKWDSTTSIRDFQRTNFYTSIYEVMYYTWPIDAIRLLLSNHSTFTDVEVFATVCRYELERVDNICHHTNDSLEQLNCLPIPFHVMKAYSMLAGPHLWIWPEVFINPHQRLGNTSWCFLAYEV